MRTYEAPRKLDSARRCQASPAAAPCVWAVGGGKGGVGKTVVTANLAIALAARGPRCIVVDADLGGANLHTVLGVPNPPRTLSHFLSGEVASLEDVVSRTSIPGVSLISGAHGMLDAANPHHSQKQKLLRHVRRLGVAHVLLDLGAGSAYNVLDLFLAARRGILVVVPEPTSIENAYHFLKAAFYRSLRAVARDPSVRPVLEHVLAGKTRRRMQSPRELIAAVSEIDRGVGRQLAERARAFRPMLIVNQVDKLEHHKVGLEVAAACDLYLGTPIDYLGALELDASVPVAVSRRQPVLQLFPGCSFAKSLGTIADRLVEAEFVVRHASARERAEARDGPPLATHGLLAWEEPAGRAVRAARPSRPATVDPRPALPPLDISQPGGYLRQCREHLGIPLAELSHRTRIRRLDRIEDERFDELPPEPYLGAYVLQYAQALGIGEAEALAASFLERSRRIAPPH
ncbi:MAG: helix-turn-helix domain-containing protein [Myxococcales bacterium]|nr:helix-turn-helix domain-containing protein [Myxococcales bacterium]